jgi:hypothetical protein
MKVVLDNKEYPVKPITIEQYLLLKNNTEIKDFELIHLLTGAPLEEVKQAPFTDVKFVAKMLLSEWSEIETTSPLDLVIVFNKKKYGLIKPSQISYEEWINLEVFMAESPLDLVKLATHLYKPLASDKVGDDRELIKYSLDECMARQNEFKDLPIKTLFSALFFLAVFVQALTERFLLSMETKKTEKTNKEETKPVIIHKKKSNNP